MIEYKAKATTITVKNLKQSWNKSKNRLHHSFRDAQRKSYCVRKEYCLTFNFFSKIKASLKAEGKWDRPLRGPDDYKDLPY